jgi:hypothetical protein
MKRHKAAAADDMRAEYDFTGGIRGKYVQPHRSARNVVLLDPDVAQGFADSRAVNQTLRALIQLARKRVKKRSKRAAK